MKLEVSEVCASNEHITYSVGDIVADREFDGETFEEYYVIIMKGAASYYTVVFNKRGYFSRNSILSKSTLDQYYKVIGKIDKITMDLKDEYRKR